MEEIHLVPIKKSEADAKILFEILKKRKTNISHKSLPAYSEHKDFVINHPYRVWYLIKAGNEFVGSAYILKNNCVGITVIKNSKAITPLVIEKLLKKHKPLKAMKSVRAAGFDFNASPKNEEYIEILKKMGARLAQVTFVFDR
jgi:hypothetical protein